MSTAPNVFPSRESAVSIGANVSMMNFEDNEIRDVLEDPQTIAIAPQMPTSLIRPLSNENIIPTSALIDNVGWGVQAVRANKSMLTGNNVLVAILDTGIHTHRSFEGVEFDEKDFTGQGSMDRNGHGTHCAGILLGRDFDGIRIGVARGVKRALIGKVLTNEGAGEAHWLFEAILWAIQEQVDVISLSIGFDVPGLVAKLVNTGWPVELATSNALDIYRRNVRLFDALMDLAKIHSGFHGGPIVVAAAGNESRRSVDKRFVIGASIPAATEEVISVGALGKRNRELNIAPFSNTSVDIAGPGVEICSASIDGGLVCLDGTSMACPFVAGVAALHWEHVRNSSLPATSKVVKSRLMASATIDDIATDVAPTDRGVGIATAP